jgi:hypothetical protein
VAVNVFSERTSERMHPYQRERALNAGLRLELREIIETGRLVGVAWRGLFGFFLYRVYGSPESELIEVVVGFRCGKTALGKN